MNQIRKWLVMSCLCLSGGIIYLLPFLREVYYIPMQKALSLNNTQLGVLMSVFGAVSMIFYFPGGWLADRVSPRKLLTIALVTSGLAGLYFATFPSYTMCIAIHAFWGISITFVFWAALIKATRNWAPSHEQGKAFGILESGRGIAEVVSSTALLAVFASLGSENLALSWVIVIFSLLTILLGFMAWFSLKDQNRTNSRTDERREKVGISDIFEVLKMPVVWLISVVILAAYSAYWGSYYFTPYATDVFLMSVVFGGAIGVGKMWLKPLAALGAGFLADKAGIARTIAGFFLVLIVSFVGFSFMPGDPKLVFILIANTAVASVAIFALRGIYFALLEEGRVPLIITGTATGIVSVIGFTPDVYMPMVGGVLLDRFPGGLGYRYFFLFIALLCVFGLSAALLILHKIVKRHKTDSPQIREVQNK